MHHKRIVRPVRFDQQQPVSFGELRCRCRPLAHVKRRAIHQLDHRRLCHEYQPLPDELFDADDLADLFLRAVKPAHIVKGLSLVPELAHRQIHHLDNLHLSRIGKNPQTVRILT